jgi:rRNA-processing protein EBP2
MGKIKKSESKGKDKDPRPKSSYASNKTNKIPLSSSDSPRQRPRITLQDVLGADKTMRRGKEGKGSDKGDVLSQSSSSSSSEMPPESEWDEQALALKEQIEGGAFDHLLMEPRRKAQQRAAGRRKPQQQGQESDDDDGSSSSSIEVVDLEGDYDEDDEAVVGKPDELEFVGRNDDVGSCSDDDSKSAMEDSEASNEEDREGSDDELDDEKSEKVDDVAESPEESDENADEDQQDRTTRLSKQNNINSKALHIVTESLQSQKHSWAWAETFDVVSTDPLPFGKKSSAGDEALVDIHDDLKREVAFYDMALAAVAQAREKCSVSKIPFSRPDDFFAEMVKTDGTLPPRPVIHSSIHSWCAYLRISRSHSRLFYSIFQTTWQRSRIG